MRVYFDTEFCDDSERPDVAPFLISVGMVREDGRELYFELASRNTHMFHIETENAAWLRENVVPHLRGPQLSVPEARGVVADFLEDIEPEFWANCGAWDWYLFRRLWGGLLDSPGGWPKHFNELKQEWHRLGRPERPPVPENAHCALADARWNKEWHEVMLRIQGCYDSAWEDHSETIDGLETLISVHDAFSPEGQILCAAQTLIQSMGSRDFEAKSKPLGDGRVEHNITVRDPSGLIGTFQEAEKPETKNPSELCVLQHPNSGRFVADSNLRDPATTAHRSFAYRMGRARAEEIQRCLGSNWVVLTTQEAEAQGAAQEST